jgi:hypothetical protein
MNLWSARLVQKHYSCLKYWDFERDTIYKWIKKRRTDAVMRGLKTRNAVVLSSYQIYHNYFRPHMTLDGKTPAYKCGIIIEGQVENGYPERI